MVEGKIYKLNIPAEGSYIATEVDGNYWGGYIYRPNWGSAYINPNYSSYLPEGSYLLSAEYSGTITINTR